MLEVVIVGRTVVDFPLCLHPSIANICLNTRPTNTQAPVEPCAGSSSKQQIKQKYKPNHQQTGLPPHSALPIRGKK